MKTQPETVVVIGAGMGGLAAALELAHKGFRVTVLDRQPGPGGKMRTVPTDAGPVDAGPTVFSMRSVFDALFHDVGEDLADHVTLTQSNLLARHHWQDGGVLDLFADAGESEAAIEAFAGPEDAMAFRKFTRRTAYLFETLDEPMMRNPDPNPLRVTWSLASDLPRILRAASPFRTMWDLLSREFRDPRLRQLFARYATYVGGSPFLSPALLTLIWQAEAKGVHLVKGGMSALAKALEKLCKARGVIFHYNADVSEIIVEQGVVHGVRLAKGEAFLAGTVVFNGDPSALGSGLLGEGAKPAAPALHRLRRSLSAYVWTFAAEPRGIELAHHNVFFGSDYVNEFNDLFRIRRMPEDPTIYLCAQDRDADNRPLQAPERFQIIMNAPADGDVVVPTEQEIRQCETRTFDRLTAAGLTLEPLAAENTLTTPWDFDRMFPGTGGAIYGAHPHSLMASFRRPTARTKIAGLYLAGGGTHPGPGVPMAALSGRHAAAAIIADRASTSRSRPTATHGGMSMDSAMTAPAASRSSGLSARSFLRIIAGRGARSR